MKQFLITLLLVFGLPIYIYSEDVTTLREKARNGDTQALAELTQKAKAGDADAQYELSKYYLPDPDSSSPTGKYWLIIAAKNGNTLAQDRLITVYSVGAYGFTKDDTKSLYWVKRLAANNKKSTEVASWQGLLAMYYHYGLCGLEKNIDEFLRWALKGANNGDSFAAYQLGKYYKDKNDKQQAIYWLKKSMDAHWQKYKEEDDIAFRDLEELGVTYHPADPVAQSQTGSNSSGSSQNQGSQVRTYTETVPAQVWQACGGCNGSGQCGVCYGSGWTYSNSSYNGKRTCSACHGSGKCTSCAGKGGQNVIRYEQRTVTAASNSTTTSSQNQGKSSQTQKSQVRAYTETVPVQVWQACGGCNGSGQCGVCYGSGWTYSNSSYNGRRTCSACHGSGRCTSCAGQGGQNIVRYEQRTVYR